MKRKNIFLKRRREEKRRKIRDRRYRKRDNKDSGLKFMTGSASAKSTYLLELDSIRTYANAV